MDIQQRINEWKCLICNKPFSQKSALVRHTKLCANPRSPNSRQKSCYQCSNAKAKCDLQRPHCSRCTLRGVRCDYPAKSNSRESLSNNSTSTPNDESIRSEREELQTAKDSSQDPSDMFRKTSAREVVESPHNEELNGPATNSPTETIENTSGLEDEQWMLSLLPLTECTRIDTIPPLAKHSMNFLFRVFRTWPHMIAKGLQLPPFLHHTLTEKNPLPLPLANCFTLAKMWSSQCEGSEKIVQKTIMKETKSLVHDIPTYNEKQLLAAVQALTVYTIMLLFPSKNQSSIPEIDPSFFDSLRQSGMHLAGTGLFLQEEALSVMPSWEAWLLVTSKRRAVFALYILHWCYSVYHHLPPVNCEETGFMPAPAAKFLWQATSRQQWEGLYGRWLLQWEGVPFLQHEFMDVKPGVGIDRRVQLWLEDADELGMLFMSLVNTAEREPEFEINILQRGPTS